jgi:folate-binding protein YgfZ
MQRSWRSLVSVEGDGRVGFLQGMLSNEIQALATGDGCRALLLDNRGKIQVDLDLWVDSQAIVMACDTAVVGTTLDTLRKYVLATPVQFREVDDELGVVGLIGPEAESLLESIDAAIPPATPYGHIKTSVGGVEVRVAHTAALAAAGVEIHAPSDELERVADTLRSAAASDLPEVVGDAAEILRIEAGRPRQGFELTGDQFPQEARLDDALSYEKGCYLGQETVARIHYRGNVNRLLVGLRAGEPLTRGASLSTDGREVGSVTSAAVSPRLGPIGLAYVRREVAAAGTELTVQAENRESREVQVSDLPFQPEGE